MKYLLLCISNMLLASGPHEELQKKGRRPPTEVPLSLDGCKYSDIFSSTRSMDDYTSESVPSDRKDCE